MYDDFDPIEGYDEESEVEELPIQQKKTFREKVNNAKESKEKWENKINNVKKHRDNFVSKRQGTTIQNNAAKNLGKNGIKSAGKSTATQAGKTAATAASKTATEAGKTAAKAGTKAAATTAKTAAKTGAKAAISTGAAAGTAGASIAVEAGLKALQVGRKVQAKVLKGLGSIAGVNFEKHHKAINIASMFALPIACCVCCFMCCFMGNTVMTANTSIVDAINESINKTLNDINLEGKKSDETYTDVTLLTMKTKDLQVLKENLIATFMDERKGLNDFLAAYPKTKAAVENKNAQEQKEKNNGNTEENPYVEVAGGALSTGTQPYPAKPTTPTNTNKPSNETGGGGAGSTGAQTQAPQIEAKPNNGAVSMGGASSTAGTSNPGGGNVPVTGGNSAAANEPTDNRKATAKAFAEEIEQYLSIEKRNFNKIKWFKVDSDKNKTEIQTMMDRETGLKYPKIEEVENVKLSDLANELHPYLMQWVIPISNFVITMDKQFVDTFDEDLLHDVTVCRYYLNKYESTLTKKSRIRMQKKVEYKNDGEGEIVTMVPVVDDNGNYIVEEVLSENEGSESVSLGEIKNVVEEGNTFWGKIIRNVEITKRDPSTKKVESTGEGQYTPDGILTETFKVTYQDTIKEEQESYEYKIHDKNGNEIEVKEDEKKEEENQDTSTSITGELTAKDYPKVTRIVNKIYSKEYKEKYPKIHLYAASELEFANDYIKKYHEDAFIKIKEGSFANTLIEQEGINFMWPVKGQEATTIINWYGDDAYKNKEGLTIVAEKDSKKKFEVVATANGKVEVVRKFGTRDKYYIEISHANGYRTKYSNIINIPKEIEVNKEVIAGEVIGQMAEGVQDNMLMKFSIEKNSLPVDPFAYFLYKEESDSKYNKIVRNFEGQVSNTMGGGGPMMMSGDWFARISAMIDDSIEMEKARKTIYSQVDRQLFENRRQTSADCSSWCANQYYRFFDGAVIGTFTGDQYPMTALSKINAMKIENYVDANGNLDTTKLMPGDLLFRNPMGTGTGSAHVIMYVGGYKGLPEDAYIHHGSGWGPQLARFNGQSAKGKKDYYDYYAIRYYRDGDIITMGTTAQGLNAPGIELGKNADNASVNKIISNYGDIIKKWSNKFGIDSGIIVGMIMAESGGDPNSAGAAKGLMQIENKHWGNNMIMKFADGTSQTAYVDPNKLANADYNIMLGCAQFVNNLENAYGNPLVAIQGYNYGPAGIKRCVGYYVKNGANTQLERCGMTEQEFQDYCRSGDTGWLSARKWYSSVGHTIFRGAGGGTPNHLEKVLGYYKQI